MVLKDHLASERRCAYGRPAAAAGEAAAAGCRNCAASVFATTSGRCARTARFASASPRPERCCAATETSPDCRSLQSKGRFFYFTLST